MIVLVVRPPRSPVWIARFSVTIRLPAGAVRDASASNTFPLY